jgi:hypothetical protein
MLSLGSRDSGFSRGLGSSFSGGCGGGRSDNRPVLG